MEKKRWYALSTFKDMIFFSERYGKTERFIQSIKIKLSAEERVAILGLMKPEPYIKRLEELGVKCKSEPAYNAYNKFDESDKKQIGVVLIKE